MKFLRKNMGAVSREPSLFMDTIKGNMKIGNKDENDQWTENAAVMANVHSFISKLPNQYVTRVSYLFVGV